MTLKKYESHSYGYYYNYISKKTEIQYKDYDEYADLPVIKVTALNLTEATKKIKNKIYKQYLVNMRYIIKHPKNWEDYLNYGEDKQILKIYKSKDVVDLKSITEITKEGNNIIHEI